MRVATSHAWLQRTRNVASPNGDVVLRYMLDFKDSAGQKECKISR